MFVNSHYFIFIPYHPITPIFYSLNALTILPPNHILRQMWKVSENSTVELYTKAIDTEAKDGYMAQVCIGIYSCIHLFKMCILKLYFYMFIHYAHLYYVYELSYFEPINLLHHHNSLITHLLHPYYNLIIPL